MEKLDIHIKGSSLMNLLLIQDKINEIIEYINNFEKEQRKENN